MNRPDEGSNLQPGVSIIEVQSGRDWKVKCFSQKQAAGSFQPGWAKTFTTCGGQRQSKWEAQIKRGSERRWKEATTWQDSIPLPEEREEKPRRLQERQMNDEHTSAVSEAET